jgi:DNA (cytosine-5)-methyltransferase 1
MNRLSVADFFCGAGGFSEGFRQKGFDVVFALDNWKPAIDTHALNHPDCKHLQMSILDISPDKIDELIPDTEIIVGSPPCVAFSGSNKAGKADKSLGMALINKFLQIITHKKNKEGSILKYWILENVPNTQKHIKQSYTFEELGLPGGSKEAIVINKSEILNAAEFGSPQTRRRMFCGDFPEPKKTHPDAKTWVTLGDVLKSLDPKKELDIIIDVNYGFSIPKEHLTDHLYDTTIEDFEWRKAERLKMDHGFMGKMSFPEDESRPSRTIMATQSSSTRESMIIGINDEAGRYIGYRSPTVREIATIMSFPLIYQFVGGSEATKHKLVGNAVCVKLIAALADAIAKEESLPSSYDPNPLKAFKKPDFILDGRPRIIKQEKPRRIKSRFNMHVPGLKIGAFRVSIDNLESDFDREIFRWRSVLHIGTGKSAKQFIIKSGDIEKMFVFVPSFETFKYDVKKEFFGVVPEPKSFQMAFCKTINNVMSPEEALYKVKVLVDKHFPDYKCSKKIIKNYTIKMKRDSIPLRILASLYACNFIIKETTLAEKTL